MKKRIESVFLSLILAVAAAAAQTDPNVAQKPPMGWNSYDCFGFSVTEAEVKANADYMAAHLKAYGWEYIVIDFLWYGEGYTNSNWMQSKPPIRIDGYGRMLPSLALHPSATDSNGFKPLADYVHGKGLKFGIHLMRGIPWNAVEQDCPVKGTELDAKDVYSKSGLCPWWHGMFTLDMNQAGSQEYYDSLIELYASWGVDFIKVDDISRGTGGEYHPKEIAAYQAAIRNSGRKMVLSLSPGPADVSNAAFLSQQANLFRISSDMWDDWNGWLLPQFRNCAKWSASTGPGHWPDADMLPLGKISIRSEAAYAHDQKPRFTRLSRDEQTTMMTLWSIFRSPLMFGGNLPDNDAFTLSLLTNEEVLAVDQNSSNNRQVSSKSGAVIWGAELPESDERIVALFNTSQTDPLNVTVKWRDLGAPASCSVRDLWNRQELGIFNNEFSAAVNRHGAGLYKIKPTASGATGDAGVKPAPNFTLNRNYPNPFNSQTRITFSTFSPAWTRLTVYDLTGREIAVLQNQFFNPGSYESIWQGADSRGRSVPSGNYLYRLTVRNGTETAGKTGEMVLIR